MSISTSKSGGNNHIETSQNNKTHVKKIPKKRVSVVSAHHPPKINIAAASSEPFFSTISKMKPNKSTPFPHLFPTPFPILGPIRILAPDDQIPPLECHPRQHRDWGERITGETKASAQRILAGARTSCNAPSPEYEVIGSRIGRDEEGGTNRSPRAYAPIQTHGFVFPPPQGNQAYLWRRELPAPGVSCDVRPTSWHPVA